MPRSKRTFRNIVIASHPKLLDAVKWGTKITAYLDSKGLSVQSGLLYDDAIQTSIQNQTADLLIVLGGDGTMLRAGHLCAPYDIPILGINLGKFGFLTEIKLPHWEAAFTKILADDYWLEHRMMLRVEHLRGNHKLGNWIVLNEAVISRGQIVRPVRLDTSIDGRYLTTYVADGLIAATPTGSTAYALAVGGPILAPELRNVVLVPVAPHLSIDRAIVLAEGSSVSIKVHTEHQAVISIDGHDPIELEDGDLVQVQSSGHKVKFVRIQDPGYFYRNLTPHMNKNPSIGTTQ
ncbi:MAG: NAD(+)/NADH kinase [Ignavibacteriaceae bacterium]|nr:NAD(+)/NADH kinase [Ignavibacteriaceae bacterium]